MWRCAIGSVAGIRRCSPALRAWATSMRWLGALLDFSEKTHTRNDRIGADRIRIAISFHNHELGSSEEEDQFRRWQRWITPAMLKHQHWVHALRQVASHKTSTLMQNARDSSRNSWTSWLQEGPASGLGRQHRMSRTAIGWIPNPSYKAISADDDQCDCDYALLEGEVVVHESPTTSTWDHAEAESPSADTVPASAQQHVDAEASRWRVHWAGGEDMPPCQWPADLGPLPPMLELSLLKLALLSFPEGLGLGWDGIHPRCLLRLCDSVLLALLRLLFLCEATGTWPTWSTAVIVALLPKSSAGLRPIGLFPWLPKIWMKIRRQEAIRWELANDRPYLYAGPGKGANVATWTQAARAEHAASTALPLSYGMSLLDLVKAFDSVPWHVLVREGRRLGYNLWILRLSIAAYRAPRLIRIDGIVSKPVTPHRSLAAGSGLATTEMRLIMIHIVDAALKVAPHANPTLYVDDLSVEVVGTDKFVLKHLGTFTRSACEGIADNLMAVSDTKSLCIASNDVWAGPSTMT